MDLTLFIQIGIAIFFGFAVGYLVRRALATRRVDSAEAKAEQILSDTRSKQKELLLQAKDKALKIIEEAKKEEAERHQELKGIQARLERRESLFDQKLLDFEEKQKTLQDRVARVEEVKQEVLKIKEDQLVKLSQIAQLSKEEAKKVLLDKTEREIKEDLLERIKKLQKEGGEMIEKKAREMITLAMQRYAGSHAAETTTTVVSLPSDEMKGRIIGREGRNIKVLEQLCGVEVIVDETPGVILVSGFSLLRRYLAKRVLEELMADGRIQPARIEETVERVKKELAREIKEAGEEACSQVGVVGLDTKLVQILGRLKFRTSYGQNNLLHSIEVAHLAGMLAEMLEADPSQAKKAGLLHDIGKAVDHEVQGGHPEIGYNIIKKFGLPEEIAYVSKGHHEDFPESLLAVIVKVADAISGGRVGARKGTFEQYVQRLEELENLAKGFQGVEKAYAIQAGREIRIFVQPDQIDDLAATKLAKEIANKIQEELKYPGEIKVTIIREKRVVEYAR